MNGSATTRRRHPPTIEWCAMTSVTTAHAPPRTGATPGARLARIGALDRSSRPRGVDRGGRDGSQARPGGISALVRGVRTAGDSSPSRRRGLNADDPGRPAPVTSVHAWARRSDGGRVLRPAGGPRRSWWARRAGGVRRGRNGGGGDPSSGCREYGSEERGDTECADDTHAASCVGSGERLAATPSWSASTDRSYSVRRALEEALGWAWCRIRPQVRCQPEASTRPGSPARTPPGSRSPRSGNRRRGCRGRWRGPGRRPRPTARGWPRSPGDAPSRRSPGGRRDRRR